MATITTINVGAVENDGTGDKARIAFGACNTNFTNLNTDKIEAVVQDTTPQLGGNLDTNSNQITSSGVMVFDAVTGYAMRINGSNAYTLGSTGFYPTVDAAYDLGTGTFRFDQTYLNNLQIDDVLLFSETGTLASKPSPTFAHQITVINDALAPVNGSAITGGGAVEVVAWSNGTNWICVAGGTDPVQTITLTGDVTGSGTGSFAATIADSAVTLAKMADVNTSTVFYRKTVGSGAPETQTLSTLKNDLGLTGTNSGDQTSIVGITGTQAQFNTALTDGSFAYSGGAFHDGFSDYVANEHIDWTSTTSNLSTTGTATAGTVYAGNPTLTVDNTFYLGASSATIPVIQFDVNDNLSYNRTGNNFSFSIGGFGVFSLSATTADFQDLAVTTTGAITGSNLSGTNTGDQTSIVGITGTTAEFNTALSDGSFATGGGTATGTNTGDQTSLTGISDTKANFDTALSDGSFMFTEVATLNDLAGVINSFATLTDGQVLTYDTTNGWQNETPASGVTDHTLLTNIGTNTHAQIDTHLGLTNEHIDWTNTTSNVVTTGTVDAGSVVAGNGTLTTDNVFKMSAGSATYPQINFDTNSYIGFNRSTDTYEFKVNLATPLSITGSSIQSTVPVFINEAASAATDIAGYGQIWTKTATPNELWFTDDAGSDYRISPTKQGTYPSANLDYTGTIEKVIAGATVTAGYLVMLQNDAARVECVHADDSTSAPILGVAITGGTVGTEIDVLVRGTVKLTGAHFTPTGNQFCYASPTAGNITSTVTSTSGDFVKIAGWCVADDVMYVNPQWNFVEVA